MTEPETLPIAEPARPADPRTLVLADLIGRLAWSMVQGAGRYEAAAERANNALRRTLEELGRSQHAQAEDLAPLARALGVPARPIDANLQEPSPPAWGVILGELFQAERALGRLAQELGALAPEPAMRALASRLAAGSAQRGREVRRLYLRYA